METNHHDSKNAKKRSHNGEEVEEAQMPKQKAMSSLPFQSAKSGTRTLKSSNTSSRPKSGYSAQIKLSASYKSSIETPQNIKKPTDSAKYIPAIVAPQKLQVSKNLSFERITSLAITDYTIKRSVTALMNQSTAWLNEKTPWQWGPATTNQTLSPVESVHHALFYYQYPDPIFAKEDELAGLSIEEDRTIQKTGDFDPIVSKLRSRWPDALLHAFRATKCAVSYRSFYLVSKQCSLYVHNQNSGSLAACINSTSYSLRKSLIKYGIKFNLPMIDLSKESPKNSDDQSSTDDNPKIDFSLDSLIIVEGIDQTTSLVNFLIECFQKGENWFGICPSIISAKPFVHASVCRLNITARETRLMDSEGKMVPHHYATVEGPVLPETFQTIAEVFRSVLDPDHHASISCKTIQSTEWCGVAHSILPLNRDTEDEGHLEATISDLQIASDSFCYTCTVNPKRGI